MEPSEILIVSGFLASLLCLGSPRLFLGRIPIVEEQRSSCDAVPGNLAIKVGYYVWDMSFGMSVPRFLFFFLDNCK